MPIEKPGNDCNNVTRFRPISQLIAGGKGLEKTPNEQDNVPSSLL